MRIGVSAGPVWISGGRRVHVHRSRFSHLSYWFFGVFMLEMAFWIGAGAALALWYTGVGAVWLCRRWRGRRSAAPVTTRPVNPRLFHSSRR